MKKKIMSVAVLAIMLSTTLLSWITSANITLQWEKNLTNDWQSKQTVNWQYNANQGEIKSNVVNDVKSNELDNQSIIKFIDTACDLSNVMCFVGDYDGDWKLDYIHLDRSNWEVKSYTFKHNYPKLVASKTINSLMDDRSWHRHNIKVILTWTNDLLWVTDNKWPILDNTSEWSNNNPYGIYRNMPKLLDFKTLNYYSILPSVSSFSPSDLQLKTLSNWKKVFWYQKNYTDSRFNYHRTYIYWTINNTYKGEYITNNALWKSISFHDSYVIDTFDNKILYYNNGKIKQINIFNHFNSPNNEYVYTYYSNSYEDSRYKIDIYVLQHSTNRNSAENKILVIKTDKTTDNVVIKKFNSPISLEWWYNWDYLDPDHSCEYRANIPNLFIVKGGHINFFLPWEKWDKGIYNININLDTNHISSELIGHYSYHFVGSSVFFRYNNVNIVDYGNKSLFNSNWTIYYIDNNWIHTVGYSSWDKTGRSSDELDMTSSIWRLNNWLTILYSFNNHIKVVKDNITNKLYIVWLYRIHYTPFWYEPEDYAGLLVYNLTDNRLEAKYTYHDNNYHRTNRYWYTEYITYLWDFMDNDFKLNETNFKNRNYSNIINY